MTNAWLAPLFLATVLAAAAPAAAQQDLAIRAGENWTHGHSGIVVPSMLGGNPLTQAKGYAADELDISLSFAPKGATDYISFYIYRNTNGAVPIWFAQAQRAIEGRGSFDGPELIEAPHAIALPGQTTASGLKAVYAVGGNNGFTSTGLALLPVGRWYVKLRISSQRRTAAQLSQLIDNVISEIGWPKEMAAAAEALPVIPCPSLLHFDKASKDVRDKNQVADIFGASLLSAAAAEKKPTTTPEQPVAPVQWCVDRILDTGIAAYRPDQSTDSYLLALGDNGNGAWIGRSEIAQLLVEMDKRKAPPRYGVTLHTAAQDIVFPAQDRLPAPERAYEIIDKGRGMGSVTTWGEKRAIEINPAALE